MFCRNCGSRLEAEDKFCVSCGTPARKPDPAGEGSYGFVPPKHIAREAITPTPDPVPKPPKETAVFCAGCGREMAKNAKFCLNCGTAAYGCAPQPQPQAEKPRKRTMRTVAIVLLILQLIALPGLLEDGILTIRGAADFFEMLGYFLPAVIGIVLLVQDKKKNG